MGRWQLCQAILMFAGAPLYLLFLLAAAAAAASDATSPFPMAPAAGLTIAWAGALYAPKLLGYAEVALSPAKRQRYGGFARFARGTLAEFGFTLLLDAISVVAKTGAMLRLAYGAAAGWTPQNRSERGVTWGEATRLLWPQTGLGVLVFAGFAAAGWRATLGRCPLPADCWQRSRFACLPPIRGSAAGCGIARLRQFPRSIRAGRASRRSRGWRCGHSPNRIEGNARC